MSQPTLDAILNHLRAGGALRLFLDYDGTLVPIARTPEEAQPDPALLDLLNRLAHQPRLQVTILSGRPLAWLRTSLPVPALGLAGTYGVELQLPGELVLERCESTSIRPKIKEIKTCWQALVGMHRGFLVEDKGLAVAFHARFAVPAEAASILSRAEKRARDSIGGEHLRILGGRRFLEVAPALAHKGQAVEWLLNHRGSSDAPPVYFGDDDKDEEAFAVVRSRGGIPIIVGKPRGPTQALGQLKSPANVRAWLELFASEVHSGT